MTFSWRRMTAILFKDYKDFSRNMAVSVVIFMPPILAALYGRMGVDSLDAYYMVFNMTFAMVGAFVQSCLIAEEKEKNTLRGLMLSPANTAEILSGKSLLSFILTMVVIVVCAFLFDYYPQNVFIILIALTISALFYIVLGTLVGLFAKSVMEASVYVLPVIGIFTFGSSITAFADKYPLLKVANYMPNAQLIEIATAVETGAGFGDILSNLSIILAWLVVFAVLTIAIYRKRMVD